MPDPVQEANTVRGRPARRWGRRLLFALLDLAVTFQLTGPFLFMGRDVTAVTPARLGIFLAGTVPVGVMLWGASRLLRRLDERGVFLSRPGAGRPGPGWIPALAVFLVMTAAARLLLPALGPAEPRETRVQITVAAGRVGVSSEYYVNGKPEPLPVSAAEGDWTLDPDGIWRASAPGSVLTLDIPAAMDADLRLIPALDGGRAEITDGDRTVRRDLKTTDPQAMPRAYHVRSGTESRLSAPVLWVLSALIGAAYALAARELLTAARGGVSHRRYGRAVFYALTGIWLLFLAAGNPGAMSPDSLSQLAQAEGVEPVTDAHPALLTFAYRLVLRIFGNVVWITVVQILLYAAAAGAFMAYLSRRGLSRRWLTGFSLLFGFHIVNGIYAATLWKDVPYTVVLLWMTLLTLRIGEEGKAFFTPWRILETGACLALVLLLRHNGAVVLAAAGLALGIAALRWRSWRPALAVVLGVGLALGIRGPVFRAAGVEAHAIYDPAEFLHGMAYAQIASGEPDPFLEELAPGWVWEEIYEPYSANSITMSPRTLEQGIPRKAAELGPGPVLRAYLAAFARHPFLIVKDRLYGCTLLWDPVPVGYNYRVCNDRDEDVVWQNSRGYYCRENALTEGVEALYALTADHPAADAAVWRTGWSVALTALLWLLALGEKKRDLLWACLPAAANSLSLVLAMAWQDYRFVYYAFVCSVFLLLSYFAPKVEVAAT